MDTEKIYIAFLILLIISYFVLTYIFRNKKNDKVQSKKLNIFFVLYILFYIYFGFVNYKDNDNTLAVKTKLLRKLNNENQSEDVAGDLTITSTQAFCSLWLMPRLFKFSQLHPDVNVRILGSNQKEDLQKKQIDLGIRFGVKNKASYTDNLVMKKSDLYQIAPKSQKLDPWVPKVRF